METVFEAPRSPSQSVKAEDNETFVPDNGVRQTKDVDELTNPDVSNRPVVSQGIVQELMRTNASNGPVESSKTKGQSTQHKRLKRTVSSRNNLCLKGEESFNAVVSTDRVIIRELVNIPFEY